MINPFISIAKAPRALKNLVLYPSIFLGVFLLSSIGRICNLYSSIIFLAMYAEAIVSLLSKEYTSSRGDFRSTWAEYKFRIIYLISLACSYCLVSILYLPLGFYSLFLYAISFCIFRLYFFEVTELVKSKNVVNPSLELIGNLSNPKGNEFNKESFRIPSRAENLICFKKIVCSSSVDEGFKSILLDKAEFSSWFSDSSFVDEAAKLFDEKFSELDSVEQMRLFQEIITYL